MTKNAGEIYDTVWGESIDTLFSDSLKVHIAGIRKKLGKDCIETVVGFGYMIA
ncbi:winged helix-turn-helix domain-containing protein [Candidatus Venteria ishoeyi]|uniref:winged helix-turn-helix domain-containing protein n=1 Tax=Candidatus Venteria ishoeyi TaxID=1899563 RepID=UPI000CDED3E0